MRRLIILLTLAYFHTVSAPVANAIVMELRPVAADGVEGVDWIAGADQNSIILMQGGQQVTVELYISQWSPDLIAVYQGTPDCSSYAFSVTGDLSTVAALVDESNSDWVFRDVVGTMIALCTDPFTCPDGESTFLSCGALPLEGGGIVDSGFVNGAYGSTFMVDVPPDAMGTARLKLDPDPTVTLLTDPAAESLPIDTFIPATIAIACETSSDCDNGYACTEDNCGDGDLCEHTAEFSTTPENCSVDARQPMTSDGSTESSWDAIVFFFPDCNEEELEISDFSVTVQQGTPPFIEKILTQNQFSIFLGLNQPIPLEQFTCITFLPTGQQRCFGYLPGDVDADGASEVADILALTEGLDDGGSISIESADINRDGNSGPEDLLRLIDLFNGAAAFDPWLGAAIGDCPSAGE